jgi:hypothetical protein
MQRTWRILALSTLMVGTLPAVAGEGQKSTDEPPTKADLPSIAKKLDEINRSLKPLEDLKTTIVALETRIKSLDDFVQQELLKVREGAREMNLKVAQAQADVLEMKRQLAQLQQNLDALGRRVGGVQTQISGYAGLPGPAPTTGRVRLVNTYPQMMTIRVNNAFYEVSPGQDRYTEPLPPGNFTYEVLGISAPQVRPLAAGETFTVTVYPR